MGDVARPCPYCGKNRVKYEGSDWCKRCVEAVLHEQEKERFAPQQRQIVRKRKSRR